MKELVQHLGLEEDEPEKTTSLTSIVAEVEMSTILVDQGISSTSEDRQKWMMRKKIMSRKRPSSFDFDTSAEATKSSISKDREKSQYLGRLWKSLEVKKSFEKSSSSSNERKKLSISKDNSGDVTMVKKRKKFLDGAIADDPWVKRGRVWWSKYV